MRGLGPAFSGTLANEVFYKDFSNQRQVGGYVGLAPSPWRSGGTDREQAAYPARDRRAATRRGCPGPDPVRPRHGDRQAGGGTGVLEKPVALSGSPVPLNTRHYETY